MKPNFIVGVPCSKLKDFIKKIDNYIPCTREDEAMALACGAWFCGKKPIVYMQNSGIGSTIDIITSLYKPYNIPLPKLILSVRTKPEHHKYMGEITKELLKILKYKNVKMVEQK